MGGDETGRFGRASDAAPRVRARRAGRVDVVPGEDERVGEELDDLLVEEAAVARAQHDNVFGRALLDALQLLQNRVEPREVGRLNHAAVWVQSGYAFRLPL